MISGRPPPQAGGWQLQAAVGCWRRQRSPVEGRQQLLPVAGGGVGRLPAAAVVCGRHRAA